jgi:hypothetical protein
MLSAVDNFGLLVSFDLLERSVVSFDIFEGAEAALGSS